MVGTSSVAALLLLRPVLGADSPLHGIFDAPVVTALLALCPVLHAQPPSFGILGTSLVDACAALRPVLVTDSNLLDSVGTSFMAALLAQLFWRATALAVLGRRRSFRGNTPPPGLCLRGAAGLVGNWCAATLCPMHAAGSSSYGTIGTPILAALLA